VGLFEVFIGYRSQILFQMKAITSMYLSFGIIYAIYVPVVMLALFYYYAPRDETGCRIQSISVLIHTALYDKNSELSKRSSFLTLGVGLGIISSSAFVLIV
jgi:hypothetical protein